ncbi:MAG: hypothetical protein ACUVXA_19330 [Candidatus Jordarchaeum sp.]|uniref:hypothetical protein n=1 Tax=Candidatus Jordarchaeum sp. TaxID=2823881 RepID=UPI0040499A40
MPTLALNLYIATSLLSSYRVAGCSHTFTLYIGQILLIRHLGLCTPISSSPSCTSSHNLKYSTEGCLISNLPPHTVDTCTASRDAIITSTWATMPRC